MPTDLEKILTRPPQALTLSQYQKLAVQADQTGSRYRNDDLSLPLLGLFGEVGSLLTELKKKHREPDSYIRYKLSVTEELGDVLWYLCLLASRAHLSIEAIAQPMARTARGKRQSKNRGITFTRFQPAITNIDRMPTASFERTLMELASVVGNLMAAYTEGTLKRKREEIPKHIANVFRALITAASDARISLAHAAHDNLKKIFDRWPLIRTYPSLFDEGCDGDEQLPRYLEIDFFEKSAGDKTYVVQRCKEINIGDRLTDNKMEEDDYRFHDVFHFSYAAVLGWSPVTRALLRVKRKSDPRVDESQDGARAIIVEEGISAWIFSNAVQMKYFENLHALSYGMLKTVHDLVKGFEVEKCPLWIWEEAILEGYEVFRKLRHHRRGRVIADLRRRTLSFRRLSL